MTAHHRTLILLATLFLASFQGCGGLGGLFGVQQPTAEYRDFKVQSLSLEDVGFDLAFDMGNPNSFALPLVSLDWDLELFESPFTSGQIYFEDAPAGSGADASDGSVLTYLGVQSIPANGEIGLHTPFKVSIPNTFEGLLRIVLGEDVPFQIAGTIYLDSNFGTLEVPFTQQGIFPNADFVDFLGEIGFDALDGLLQQS